MIMVSAKATFFDDNKKVYVSYELAYKFLGEEIANDILDAFSTLTGHYHCRSRDQAWRSVKRFTDYLLFIGFSNDSYGLDIIEGFGLYLTNNHKLKKTNGTHYVFIKRMVNWLSEETGRPIWQNHGLTHVNFTREIETVRDNFISPERLRNISLACKRAIKKTKRDFEVRARLEAGEDGGDDKLSSRDMSNLAKLIAYEAEGVWTQRQLIDSGSATLGGVGIRRLARYKELTQEACLPIFLLIMIQTAANPFALMEINKDCLVVNPLDESAITLKWSKGRASRVQRMSSLSQGSYSVSTLVNLIIKMTQPIRHLAPIADNEFLFITRTGTKAKRLCIQGLHNYLADFRGQHGLGYFTFSDLRKAVASLVYSNSGSVEDVTQLLQHKNVKTTEIYLRGDAVRQQRLINVTRFQGMMVELAEATSESTVEAYDTTLGFRCAAPLSGHIARSKKGEPCLEFLACAGCKNAIVAVDDARIISRIIRARDHLIKMEYSSHFSTDARTRYVHLFQPILTIIQEEVLAAVAKPVIKKAEMLALELHTLPEIY